MASTHGRCPRTCCGLRVRPGARCSWVGTGAAWTLPDNQQMSRNQSRRNNDLPRDVLGPGDAALEDDADFAWCPTLDASEDRVRLILCSLGWDWGLGLGEDGAEVDNDEDVVVLVVLVLVALVALAVVVTASPATAPRSASVVCSTGTCHVAF